MLYNSLGRKKQRLKPIEGKNVRMYSCGITAYYTPHMGNMRRYLGDDIIKRVMMHNGYAVKHVENVTDVGHLVSDADTGDDKLRLAAEHEHKSMREMADFYAKLFFDGCALLNILNPDIICKASEHVNEMIALLEKLDGKGFLYKAENGIYFDTSKFKGYGKLTGLTFKQLNAQLREGARVEIVKGKRHATDFAVWRFAPPQQTEMVWESRWGRGFPGWHLECSAMSMKYLGNHFDVHTGGIDHLQIHHPNEIAQSEASTGEKFVNHWTHHNFLLVNNRKMSKSAGTLYTLQYVIEKGHSPMAIRLFLISGHYRQSLNFTFEALSNAENTLNGIYSFLGRLSNAANKAANDDTASFIKSVRSLKREFFARLNDDIGMPEALAAMHSLIGIANARPNLNRREARAVAKAMLGMDAVLGLRFGEHYSKGNARLGREEKALLKEREEARRAGDFKRSDEIRVLLMERHKIVVEDTKEGQTWRKASR